MWVVFVFIGILLIAFLCAFYRTFNSPTLKIEPTVTVQEKLEDITTKEIPTYWPEKIVETDEQQEQEVKAPVFLDGKRYSIVLFSPDFADDCGGIQVLFEMARVIDENPNWRALMCTRKNVENSTFTNFIDKDQIRLLDMDKTVVLYPEIVDGNPIPEAKHVARLILFKIDPKIQVTWRETDMIYYFSSFGNDEISTEKLFYCLREQPSELLREQPKERKINSCMWRKWDHFHSEENVQEWMPTDLLNLDRFGTFAEKREKLQSSLTFYSADPYTYWSFIAAFNGAVSVIMPINMTKSEWAASLFLGDYLRNEFDPMAYVDTLVEFSQEEIVARQPFGVAWGTDEREILWAKRTMQFAEKQHAAANHLGKQRISSRLADWESLFKQNQ